MTSARAAGRGTAFAGKSDLAAVHRMLADGCRVLALSGPPGAGKSTLALHVAHEWRGDYPDGELFAALRGAEPDPDRSRRRRCSPASSTGSGCRKTSGAAGLTTSPHATAPRSPTGAC